MKVEPRYVKQSHHSFRRSKVRTKSSKELQKELGIPTSDQITGIEIRLSRVYIKNNKTPKIGPFPGYAKVYFICLIASDVANQTPKLEIKAFPKIDDNEELPIDKTVYFWKQTKKNTTPPSQIHVFSSIVKSKKSLRDVGKIMTEVKKDKEYKSVLKTIAGAVSGATAAGALVDQVTNLASIVGRFLGKVEDRPLISILQSYTDINGDFDSLGKVRKEFPNRYATIGLSITIRDKVREDIIAEALDLDS
jgi:hypothetical protein